MKTTGIVRKIDDLGRMVIPIELRKTLILLNMRAELSAIVAKEIAYNTPIKLDL